MNNNTHFISRLMHFLGKSIKIIAVPILGMVEALIATSLLLAFIFLRGLEKVFHFVDSKMIPGIRKIAAAVRQILNLFVNTAIQFHDFMNQPVEGRPKVLAKFIAFFNLLLKPIYVVAQLLYKLVNKVDDVVCTDLEALSAWLAFKWQAFAKKNGLTQEDSKAQREKFTEKYSANGLNDQYQTYAKLKFDLFEAQWKVFTEEIAQVYEQARVFFTSKPQRDSVDQLSAFAQERNNIIVASVLINLLALAFPLLMLQLYDRILSHHSVDTLVVFCVAVATAVALEAVIRIFRSYTTAWISARFEHHGYVSKPSANANFPLSF